jgi:hypothetical protein
VKQRRALELLAEQRRDEVEQRLVGFARCGEADREDAVRPAGVHNRDDPPARRRGGRRLGGGGDRQRSPPVRAGGSMAEDLARGAEQSHRPAQRPRGSGD